MGKEVTKTEAAESGLIITIAGRAARGKTTVARLIEETLRREGFVDVSVYDSLSDTPGKPPIDERVEQTKQRVIVIETVQLPRLTSELTKVATVESGRTDTSKPNIANPPRSNE